MFELMLALMLVTGALLVFMFIWTRGDALYLSSGIALVLLTVFVSIEVYVIPQTSQPNRALLWLRTQHAVACALSFSLWWCLFLRAGATRKWFLHVMGALSLVLALLSMSPVLVTVTDGGVHPTALYAWFFLPYLSVLGITAARLLYLSHRVASTAAQRRLVLYQAAGISWIFLCGVVDSVLFAVVGLGRLPLPSIAGIGVLGFSVAIMLVFVEQFLMFLRERDLAFERVRAAYEELEQASDVRQLGESSAMVGHELRNDLALVRMGLSYLQRGNLVLPGGTAQVEEMLTRVEKTIRFSQDVLALVRSRVVRQKDPLNLVAVVQKCIDSSFDDRRGHFEWDPHTPACIVHGDWQRLETLFGNLFRNSLEAGASRVQIRFNHVFGMVVVSIEDDGVGCADPVALSRFFTAFHTTKLKVKGAGLGLSVAKAIVESHGGRISAHSITLAGAARHGLCIDLTFPLSIEHAPTAATPLDTVALIKEGIGNLEAVMRVFRNVQVVPRVCTSVREAVERRWPESMKLVFISGAHAGEWPAVAGAPATLVLLSTDSAGAYALRPSHSGAPELFREEFVVHCLKPLVNAQES